jgi:hypothetical protein
METPEADEIWSSTYWAMKYLINLSLTNWYEISFVELMYEWGYSGNNDIYKVPLANCHRIPYKVKVKVKCTL